MRHIAFYLMICVAVVLGVSSAQAITVGPATYSISFSGGSIPGAVSVDGATTPQSASYDYLGGTLSVHAEAAATAQPAASASVVSGVACCAGSHYDAIAEVHYQIAVDGTPGVMVPFFFDTAGGFTYSGQFPSAFMRVQLIPTGGLGLTGFTASTYLFSSGTTSCGPVCINGTQQVSLLTNTIYNITVRASASANTNTPASVSSWADPYIYIDPAFVGGDQFSLLISDGIGNAPLTTTPIPAALPLFLAGLAGMGFLGARRRHSAGAGSIS